MRNTAIRLSELPGYRKAIIAAADRDYAVARAAYLQCISVCRNANDISNLGFLLQNLGDVEAEAGNRELAERYHQEAIALDPASPLPWLFYARSLFRHVHDAEAAIAELHRAQSMLAPSNFPCDAEELPLDYYEREIAKLRAEIRGSVRHREP